MQHYALLSVYDKKGLDQLTHCLVRNEFILVGSGGTAEQLRKLGQDIIEVSEYTGMQEMPNGLVKTLHPKIHAGILGDWNDPVQKSYLEKNHVNPIDFVIVNLYPFGEIIKSDPRNVIKAIDNIDIGGPALIRAAAKGALLNHRVVPVTNPGHYQIIIDDLNQYSKVSEPLRHKLILDAFSVTANYDVLIRDYFQKLKQ